MYRVVIATSDIEEVLHVHKLLITMEMVPSELPASHNWQSCKVCHTIPINGCVLRMRGCTVDQYQCECCGSFW